MQPVVSIQQFRALGLQAGPESASDLVQVKLGSGQEPATLSLQKPTNPPSLWSSLVGALVGTPTPTTAAPSAGGEVTLLQFRSALASGYHGDIGANVARTLEGDKLTLSLMNRAIAMADREQAEFRAGKVDAFAATLRGSLVQDGAGTPGPGEPAPPFHRSFPDRACCELLRQAFMVKDILSASSKDIREDAGKAAAWFDAMRQTPGMSMPRLMATLEFALAGPADQVRTVLARETALERPNQAGPTVLPGTAIAGTLPDTIAATGSSDRQAFAEAMKSETSFLAGPNPGLRDLHREVARQVGLMQTAVEPMSVKIADGRTVQIAHQVHRDAVGADYSVQGRTLARTPEAVAAGLLSALPAGEPGERMLPKVSAALCQALQMQLAKFTALHGFLQGKDNTGGSRQSYDLWTGADGLLHARAGTFQRFSAAIIGVEQVETPASAVRMAVECVFDLRAGNEAPLLVQVHTDMAYTSAAAAADGKQAQTP
ncbi:hypothetical protein ACT80S_01450 [Ramlibacter sp. MAHUQ-53]|uniref:hypothetical protein n=1 Tax=unclassified Ramlibacter TaxID=2617605 RepID=UPI0036352E32